MTDSDEKKTGPVPPRSLDRAIAHVKGGGRLMVRTFARTTVIDAKVLRRFDDAGVKVLREEGDGYRMANGKSSVYLFPGQLEYTD